MRITSILLSGLMLSLSLSVHATEEHPGKEIHDEGCLSCHKGTKGRDHDAAFYMREDRKTKDYKRLHTMVQMCDSRMGTAMFDEDMQLVTDYLNDTYYKFPKK